MATLGAAGILHEDAGVTSPRKTPIKSLSLEEIEAKLVALGQKKYRAKQVANWLYEKRVKSFAEMSDLPAALREQLAAEFSFEDLKPIRKTGSSDTTQKFLFQLDDGSMIESVLIPASPALYGETSDRRTICVSTQVGCAYGCKFCASGLDGFSRNLHAGEIVEQVLRVEELSGERVNNIVFMGMGEPLANYENLTRAITILNAPWGMEIGARHITVSTSGLAPRIRDLADQPVPVRLAISLHGATDDVRQQIMPVNRKYPLAVLLDACGYWQSRKKKGLGFEYILINRVNDTPEQARTLAQHALRLNAKVNLIPYNKVEGLEWERPPLARQDAFLRMVRNAGVVATIRREKGHDIDAACGQLRLQTQRDFAGDKSFAETNNAS
ncbi:MAG: rRNA (adenine2503-C2)-methyltransferase [Chthoniobacter sp.]|jgi:23S rRNA (adenine2503-C2)-methyltransferase|nr:rRNA (adenine2503-C2)-methyltransferase [Chthoniobacter sp.]